MTSRFLLEVRSERVHDPVSPVRAWLSIHLLTGNLTITLCISSQIPVDICGGFRVLVVIVAIWIVALSILSIILSVLEPIIIALTLGHVSAREVVVLVVVRIGLVMPIPPIMIDPRIDEDSRVDSTSVSVESLPSLSLRRCLRQRHKPKQEADHKK